MEADRIEHVYVDHTDIIFVRATQRTTTSSSRIAKKDSSSSMIVEVGLGPSSVETNGKMHMFLLEVVRAGMAVLELLNGEKKVVLAASCIHGDGQDEG